MTLSEATWSLSRFTSGRHCHLTLLLRLRETLNELIIPFVISGVFPIGHHRSRDTCWVPRELIPRYNKRGRHRILLFLLTRFADLTKAVAGRLLTYWKRERRRISLFLYISERYIYIILLQANILRYTAVLFLSNLTCPIIVCYWSYPKWNGFLRLVLASSLWNSFPT